MIHLCGLSQLFCMIPCACEMESTEVMLIVVQVLADMPTCPYTKDAILFPKPSSSVSQPVCEDSFPNVSNPFCKLNELSKLTFLDSLRDKWNKLSSFKLHKVLRNTEMFLFILWKIFCFHVAEFQPLSALHSCSKFSLQNFWLLCHDCLEECKQSIEKSVDLNRENAHKEPGQTHLHVKGWRKLGDNNTEL